MFSHFIPCTNMFTIRSKRKKYAGHLIGGLRSEIYTVFDQQL